MRLVLAVLFVLIGTLAGKAQPPEELDALAAEAFFSVVVSGTAADGAEDTRFGKAFAIAPDVVITALHVVGTKSEWKSRPDDATGVNRAARPVMRQIALQRRGEAASQTSNFVLPGLSEDVDAAAFSAPGLAIKRFFRLSLCPIRTGERFSALVSTSDDPAGADTVDDVTTISLVAQDFRPAQFDGLVVFGVGPYPDFHPEMNGHEGSPILDENGDVVAIISAVVADGGGHLVLATPIKPLLPGAQSALLEATLGGGASDGRLRCSLAETVDRLQDDVSKLIIWDVEVDYDKTDGKMNTVALTYSNAGATSRMTALRLYYEFWGVGDKIPRPDTEIGRITFADTNADSVVMFHPQRTIETLEVGRIGRQLVEPHVSSKAGEKGSVQLVKLYITPFFGDVEGVTTVKKYPWIVALPPKANAGGNND